MKTFNIEHSTPNIQWVKRLGRSLALPCALGAIVLSLLTSAPTTTQGAPTSVPLAIYPLTNALVGTTNYMAITNGVMTIAASRANTVSCQPFQIWRGRGFTLNAGITGGNASDTANTVFVFQFASVHAVNYNSANGYVTNWLTPLTPVAVAANGATEVLWWTNIQASAVDNVSLGQLLYITNGSGTYSCTIDPTNTFIGVYP
ncbi:MAG TPA: hypothetical protein VGN23_07540 [Verrucomicrobiae bacterium]|jgi:hypothetical protein